MKNRETLLSEFSLFHEFDLDDFYIFDDQWEPIQILWLEAYKRGYKDASPQSDSENTKGVATESVSQPEIKFCENCGTALGCRIFIDTDR